MDTGLVGASRLPRALQDSVWAGGSDGRDGPRHGEGAGSCHSRKRVLGEGTRCRRHRRPASPWRGLCFSSLFFCGCWPCHRHPQDTRCWWGKYRDVSPPAVGRAVGNRRGSGQLAARLRWGGTRLVKMPKKSKSKHGLLQKTAPQLRTPAVSSACQQPPQSARPHCRPCVGL